jgi:selenocysteine lyase/cysteine desulfurase
MTVMLDGLTNIDGVEVYGTVNPQERLGLVCFNVKGADPYAVSLWLDEHAGIMVRAGLHCSPQAHRVSGTLETGALRASVGYFNTVGDVSCLIESVKEYVKQHRS